MGNYVAQNLAEKGLSVRVLVQKVARKSVWDRLGIEQIHGDFSDIGSLLPALEGVEKFLFQPSCRKSRPIRNQFH